ncbi:MAG: dTDP-4-dehydrorhamnose reductase, partial [Deltaproteobacteria bacterium]
CRHVAELCAMKVWVLGASGMLGRTVCEALQAASVDHVGSGHEVDIAQPEALLAYAQTHAVTHLINCAAYTKVDACETEQLQAARINADGPARLGELSASLRLPALHISTDYVFAGDAIAPYDEAAACAPQGVYGRTKLAGEQRFLAAGGALVVRTSWLYGVHGNNFVATMLRLMSARPMVAVVADQVGSPCYSNDLGGALLRLLGLLPGHPQAASGIYHYANAGSTSWHGFAMAILQRGRALGHRLRCEEVVALRTEQYPTAARRPAYSVLGTHKVAAALGAPPRPWQQALDDYLQTMAPQYGG